MTDFEALLSEVRRCKICEPHLPLGARPVLQLHPDARILIAGQAPGLKVHQSGIPFADASGDRLREWLGISEEVFYDPHQIAILPMGFCYPGSGKSGDLPPRPECAATWRSRLLNVLTNLRLTIVIGQYALRYHLPQEKGNLTEIVKNWQQYFPEVIPLPHPSPRNNRWLKKNPWFESELLPTLRVTVKKALNESGNGGV
jgi:uracil-DNA glycosylase